MDLLLKNARVFVDGRFADVDIRVRGGVIEELAPALSSRGETVIDLARGDCVVLPGLSDVHVHLREPGYSYKETVRTGTLAAARGGFTTVCAMPNLKPVPDTLENLRQELDIIERDAVVHVLPYGAITKGEKGEELADMAAMAPYVAGFSDDGRGVQSAEMMRAAMAEAKRLGKIIVSHCEVEVLLTGGCIHDGKYARLHGHGGISSESEWGQIRRDIDLVRQTGADYHICHISAKESVELLRRAKAEGLPVTGETGPHYLALCDMDLEEDGRFKMNPPIRSAADRDALIAGLADGTVDMIITDHAPHSAEEKGRGLEGSLMGVVGLETSFAACYTYLVKTGKLSLEKLVDLMHGAPKRRFGVGSDLRTGARADLAVFDLERSFKVDPAEFRSMGRATPFEGDTLWGRCLLTLCDGEAVWKEKDL